MASGHLKNLSNLGFQQIDDTKSATSKHALRVSLLSWNCGQKAANRKNHPVF
jgi:hypothetical protein